MPKESTRSQREHAAELALNRAVGHAWMLRCFQIALTHGLVNSPTKSAELASTILTKLRAAIKETATVLPALHKIMDSPTQAIPDRWTFRVRLELARIERFYGYELTVRENARARGESEDVASSKHLARPLDKEFLNQLDELVDVLETRCAELSLARHTSGQWKWPELDRSPLIPKTRRGLQRLVSTSVKDDAIVAALSEGKSYRRIQRELGVSKSTVGRVARDRGMTGHTPEVVPDEGTLSEKLTIRVRSRRRGSSPG